MIATWLMTREQIEALQPGRELDALVAEKVMGYKWKRPVKYPDSGFSLVDDDFDYWTERKPDEPLKLHGLAYGSVKYFSNDPAAHAALWDKLVSLDWKVRVETTFEGMTEAHSALVWHTHETEHYSRGRTRYHALAKAALLVYAEGK